VQHDEAAQREDDIGVERRPSVALDDDLRHRVDRGTELLR
jgi:hypothetical protein